MMSTEKLWKELTNDKIPWPASLLAQSCEEELKELMTQIDRMIHNKKREWEHEAESLKAKLKLKEQEGLLLQATLDDRSRELGQARSKLEEVEMSKNARLAEYEAQVGYLRQEVQNMTRQYDRLRRKMEKQTRQLEREREKVDGHRREDDGERRDLERRLEESQAARTDLERQLLIAQQRAESSAANCQALEEKNVFLQTQFKNYQEQLEKRKQILENSESRFQARLVQLEDQLRTTRENLAHQTCLAERLKRTQEETSAGYKKAMDEREIVERDLRSARQSVLRLEEEVRRVTSDLARKEKQVSRTESDLAQRLEELGAAQATIRRKSEALAALELAREPEEEGRVAKEMEELRESVKSHRRSEKRMKDDLGMAKRRIADLEKYNAQIVERLHKAKEDISKAQSYEVATMKDELKRPEPDLSLFPSPAISFCEMVKPGVKARDALVSAEETHAEQVSLSRRSQVEADERVATVQRREADAGERLSAAERRLKAAQESGDRLAAELHVANAQLEALRLENRHLRGSPPSLDPGPGPAPAPVPVPSPSPVVHARPRPKSPPAAPEVAVPPAREAELQRRVKDLMDDKAALSRELEQQVDTLRRLSLENKAMASFVSGVSMALSTSPAEVKLDRPESTPGPCGDSQQSLFQQQNNNCVKRSADDEVESLRSLLRATSMSGLDAVSGGGGAETTTDPTVARFLAEERERSLELEHLINSHIEELKTETERTLADYRRDVMSPSIDDRVY